MPKSLQFCFRPRRKGTHPGLHPVEGPALVFPQLSPPSPEGNESTGLWGCAHPESPAPSCPDSQGPGTTECFPDDPMLPPKAGEGSSAVHSEERVTSL